MAFNGSLLSLGGSNFPLKYVFKESYKVTPNRRQDLDPYRDANGNLHRNVLSHTATTISFQTKPMWNDEMATLMAFIRNRYTDQDEKKLSITYYSPDTDSYKTGNFYMPDMEFNMDMVDTVKKKVMYKSMTLEFIEY